jgi:hypothetical protein
MVLNSLERALKDYMKRRKIADTSDYFLISKSEIHEDILWHYKDGVYVPDVIRINLEVRHPDIENPCFTKVDGEPRPVYKPGACAASAKSLESSLLSNAAFHSSEKIDIGNPVSIGGINHDWFRYGIPTTIVFWTDNGDCPVKDAKKQVSAKRIADDVEKYLEKIDPQNEKTR